MILEIVFLIKKIKEVVDVGVEFMILEVLSYGLVLGWLWGVEFDVVIFLNLI